MQTKTLRLHLIFSKEVRSKPQVTAHATEDVEKGIIYCWWGCKPIQPLWKSVWSILRKLGIYVPQDPVTSLLSIYPKIALSYCKTAMFLAVLFIIVKFRNNLDIPNRRMKKLWYIYTMELYSAILKMASGNLKVNGWNINTSSSVR